MNTLRTSAEDFGTLAENDSSTGYESNDHFTKEAYVEYTQESSGEQQFPDDFDYDDVTIGQTLMRAKDEPITLKKKACRPVCRRQSVMIERGKPCCLPIQVERRWVLKSECVSCKNSEKILWMKEFLNTETHTPVHFMNYL